MKTKTPLVDAFEELAPRYESVVDGELQRFWGWNYRSFIDRLLDELCISQDARILDIATGTLVIPKQILIRWPFNLQVFGLDITYSMLCQGKRSLAADPVSNGRPRVSLACGDAMQMPFCTASFDIAVCGLATHHMRAADLLGEASRVLRPGGSLVIGDVGSSAAWRLPGVRFLLRTATFVYFIFKENIHRALAEASAVPNVHTEDEWRVMLAQAGFTRLSVTKLKSSRAWVPGPLLITAQKEYTPERMIIP